MCVSVKWSMEEQIPQFHEQYVSTSITTDNIIVEKFLEITFKYNTVAINSF